MIDFDYKIYNMSDLLTNEEFNEVNDLLNDFNIDLTKIDSPLGFLQWSQRIQDTMKTKYPNDYERMSSQNSFGYEDFKKLSILNDELGVSEDDYFNFLLTFRDDKIIQTRLVKLYEKAYKSILKDIFKKEVREDLLTLFGHFNVYPKDSFIKKHSDLPFGGGRYFTTLFFVNKNRKYEDGSLLKIYTENEVVDIVPDYNTIILLDHMNYNYIHEVTKNLVDDVRYSLYTPFNFEDYDKFLI